jgi:hypothetical protein
MENLPKPYPFGLESMGFAYQDTVHYLFMDHAERNHIFDLYVIDPADFDQPAPMVNMVAICQLTDDSIDPTESLHNILNESPDESSEASMKTALGCPTFPLGFGGMIFHVNMDSGTKDGKTPKEREACLVNNAACQRRRDDEAAQGANSQDTNGLPCTHCNLQEEFDMVGDQPVHKTQAPTSQLPSTSMKNSANLRKLRRSDLTSWRHRFKLMRSRIRFHLICLLQHVAIALITMVEASIRTTSALNIRVVVPISTEVQGSTMKLTLATMEALHALREAEAATVMINMK